MEKEKLADIMQRGGIFKDIKGNKPEEVLGSLINLMPPNEALPKDTLLKAVLEREALMSTGIGRGIAIPHPRSHLLESEQDQIINIAFLENPVDWNSIDGEKVDTLILIISASTRQHLHTLSAINFLCRQDDFCIMLKERSSLEKLLVFIREVEKQWI